MSTKTARAHTLKTIHSIHAGAAVFAWLRTAFVNVNTTIFTRKSRPARTSIIIVQIDTRSTVCTWFRQTEINFFRACGSNESGHTLTAKLIDHVHASAAIQAWITIAIVNIRFTSQTGETQRACAHKCIGFIRTSAAIFTWIRITFVNLNITIYAAVALWTCTHKPHRCVSTCSMDARFFRTRHCFRFTMLSHPTFAAFASVRFTKGLVRAFAAVQTRLIFAVTHFGFAFGSCVAGRALAREGSLAGVKTSAAVLAWPMVCAIIQVLVAK